MIFKEWIEDNSKTILFDGAMGTQLMKEVSESTALPDLLNIEKPETVKKILANYYHSGSDMVQTCTFSSNLVNLKKHNLADRIIDINKAALENVSLVRNPDKLIVGDIGPSGEFRPPVGEASGDQWYYGFKSKLKC